MLFFLPPALSIAFSAITFTIAFFTTRNNHWNTGFVSQDSGTTSSSLAATAHVSTNLLYSAAVALFITLLVLWPLYGCFALAFRATDRLVAFLANVVFIVLVVVLVMQVWEGPAGAGVDVEKFRVGVLRLYNESASKIVSDIARKANESQGMRELCNNVDRHGVIGVLGLIWSKYANRF
ncbi:hypothetical protein DIS24_g4128 [Lasiodiplodia hormozganensis]|uniref:Uncharacterized protein n=1 Tax=Lasiodiplodia hormozganensis TaxID=869390 RepID=A0AA40D1H3_9PEZI|nr:hypothetical protein DIS24_g4128 [Lasiodiplodia hormozganensis]